MKVLKIVLIVLFGLSHTFSQSPFDEEKEVKDEGNVVKESSPLTEEIDEKKAVSDASFLTKMKNARKSAKKRRYSAQVEIDTSSSAFTIGTRSSSRNPMSSPTPADVLGKNDLKLQGNGDLTETLKNQLPYFSATPLTGIGSSFVRSISMRGLPSDNVLVLTNSKRRHRSSLIAHYGPAMNIGAQGSDIGMIPSIAIKRLEVLLDGASAQYGSDAIAGAMNMLLKDNSEGVEFQVTSGTWMTAPNGRGGERDITAAANIGLPLSEEGFLNISAEYSSRPELSRGEQHTSAIDGYRGWNSSWGDDEQDNVDEWQTAMNWGRSENNGFRSVWNAGLDVSENIKAYSFGNYASTYGEYSFFLMILVIAH